MTKIHVIFIDEFRDRIFTLIIFFVFKFILDIFSQYDFKRTVFLAWIYVFLNFFIDMTFADVGNKTQVDSLVNVEKMVSYLGSFFH